MVVTLEVGGVPEIEIQPLSNELNQKKNYRSMRSLLQDNE